MREVFFRAPWGSPLKVMTGACVVICCALPWFGFLISLPGVPPEWKKIWMAAPFLFLIGSAFFMVRGYVLTPDAVRVKRLMWETRVEWNHLTTATFDPDALRGSTRVFGNGGLFSFSGLFYNKKIGRYRAYVTDMKKAVILRLPQKTVVISPEDPAKFVTELEAMRQMVP